MTELVVIEATEPAVVARTIKAQRASEALTHSLEIRCATPRCGSRLAIVGVVPKYGPLFWSTWKTPTPGVGTVSTGTDDIDDTAPVRKQLAVLEAAGGDVDRFGALDHDEVAAVLLILPPDMTQDHPPLFVRCVRHGDAVLDRRTLLGWMPPKPGSPAVRHVPVSLPRRRYAPLVMELHGVRSKTKSGWSVSLPPPDPCTTPSD